MKKFQDLTIHNKLIVIIMTVTLSMLLLASTVMMVYDILQIRQVMSDEMKNSAKLLGNRSSAALVFDDPDLAMENLQALKDLPHVRMGCIYSGDGSLFALYLFSKDKKNRCPEIIDNSDNQVNFREDYMQLTMPINIENKRLGYIYLRYSLDPINHHIAQQVYVTFILMLILGVIAFGLSKHLQKLISKPLIDVAKVASDIEQYGDYSQRAPNTGKDEIGKLSTAFNAMLNTIEQQNNELLEAKNNLEVEVLSRTRDLESAIKELESFSYSVSHDLRAPLRSISGFSTVIQEDYNEILDENGQDLLSRVICNAHRMSELIDDLLELSRLGRKSLQMVNVDFDALTHEVINNLKHNEQQRAVEFRCEKLGSVNADKRLLKIVMENILGNAWKYTSKKTDAMVIVGTKTIDDETVYYVQDNGAGFDMSYVDKIFGAFQRLHKPDDFEGTGIGLATVQRIIHRHGGRIWVEAAINEGATFYFTLPYERK